MESAVLPLAVGPATTTSGVSGPVFPAISSTKVATSLC